jgi:aryl-alcohol dehydrogenase-like predicted oxidoreductase
VIPYSPLGGGFLTGKYRRGGSLPKGARSRMIMEGATDQAFDVIEALDEVSQSHGAGQAATALAWLLSKPAVAAPIVGANSADQLQGLLPASDLRLTAEELSRLDRISAGL